MKRARKVFSILRIIIRALLVTIVAVLAAYNVYMLIQRYAYGNGMPKVFGVATAVVVSGSMEPEISVGDLVVVKEAEVYNEDEVITFYKDGAYITHRIISVNGAANGGEVSFETKGDANDSPDKFATKVTRADVVGKVVKVYRGAGNVISFFQSPAGLLTVFAVGVVIWALTDLISILLKKKDKVNEDEREKD